MLKLSAGHSPEFDTLTLKVTVPVMKSASSGKYVGCSMFDWSKYPEPLWDQIIPLSISTFV